MDITVIGAAIIDILTGPVNAQVFESGSKAMDVTKLSFGGDALNEAVALSRLGKKVQLISKVGNDEAGASVLDYIRKNGIATDSIAVEDNLVTGMNIVLIDENGERSFLTNPNGSLRKLAVKDIEPYLENVSDIVSFASVFVSPLMDLPSMERIFKQIKSKPGRILVADMTKAKNGETLLDIKPLLQYIDYIMPNEEEIALLTGEKDPYINAWLLVEAGVKCAVVKCGKRGCIIKTKEEMYEIDACLAEKVIDTTGAGDCFVAGFLWALSEGKALEECGRYACATASYAVENVGATEGIKDISKIRERILANYEI